VKEGMTIIPIATLAEALPYIFPGHPFRPKKKTATKKHK
jgi:hypothetical protein